MEVKSKNAQKAEILRSNGYRYNFDRMIYLNRKAKKAFSADYVDDHNLEEIRASIEKEPTSDWQFFFNSPPSSGVKRELGEVLHLWPAVQ